MSLRTRTTAEGPRSDPKAPLTAAVTSCQQLQVRLEKHPTAPGGPYSGVASGFSACMESDHDPPRKPNTAVRNARGVNPKTQQRRKARRPAPAARPFSLAGFENDDNRVLSSSSVGVLNEFSDGRDGGSSRVATGRRDAAQRPPHRHHHPREPRMARSAGAGVSGPQKSEKARGR